MLSAVTGVRVSLCVVAVLHFFTLFLLSFTDDLPIWGKCCCLVCLIGKNNIFLMSVYLNIHVHFH